MRERVDGLIAIKHCMAGLGEVRRTGQKEGTGVLTRPAATMSAEASWGERDIADGEERDRATL